MHKIIYKQICITKMQEVGIIRSWIADRVKDLNAYEISKQLWYHVAIEQEETDLDITVKIVLYFNNESDLVEFTMRN